MNAATIYPEGVKMQDSSPGKWPSDLAPFSSALEHLNPEGAVKMLLKPYASFTKSIGHKRKVF